MDDAWSIPNARSSYGHNVVFGMNEFGDVTATEFAASRTMPRARSPAMPKPRYVESDYSAPLPAAWDWRNFSAVTPVNNQGSTGTCWAFSTVEAIESQWFLAGNSLTALSVEMVVDCDNSSNPDNDNADCGVFG